MRDQDHKYYTIWDSRICWEVGDRTGKPYVTIGSAKRKINAMLREKKQYPWRKTSASDDPQDYHIRTYKLQLVREDPFETSQ